MSLPEPAETRVCFATLLTTDTYLHGALTLAASLRATGTSHDIICLVADGQLSRPALERLHTAFDKVVCVPILQTDDIAHLALLGRPDLGSTVTKIGVWSLTEYERVAFLDADTLVLGSIDSLLEADPQADIRPNGGMQNEGLLAAAPDLGWPDCFNSGVFVAKPAKATHARLLQLLSTDGSFDGGDQGLLNTYFGDWARADHTRRLPFAYNATSTSFYSYAPAFARFADSIKVVHFVGTRKPWRWARASDGTLLPDNNSSGGSSFTAYIERWWQMHDAHVSRWSPEKGPFSTETALLTSGNFDGRASSTGQEDAGGTWPEVSQAVLAATHASDNEWQKNGRGIHAATAERSSADDSWGAFTPAPDFALSPVSSGASSGASSGRASKVGIAHDQ
ncbi:glycogenin glucosyltransferase [Coemansia sp. RSA 552]|nr:glycogenin glucosyltransferase [Coemansia sp. RSA 552]